MFRTPIVHFVILAFLTMFVSNEYVFAGKVDEGKVLAKYSHVDPDHLISDSILKRALLYYDSHKPKFANKDFFAIIDFALNSSLPRFFILNLHDGQVWAIHSAHGKGSDKDHDGLAERFSNKPRSNASALGIYRTSDVYWGSHGRSLKLDGLSTTNSNARKRKIVIHPASYVREEEVVQGRSWGCPAVAPENIDRVIDSLKGGSLIYAGKSN